VGGDDYEKRCLGSVANPFLSDLHSRGREAAVGNLVVKNEDEKGEAKIPRRATYLGTTKIKPPLGKKARKSAETRQHTVKCKTISWNANQGGGRPCNKISTVEALFEKNP